VRHVAGLREVRRARRHLRSQERGAAVEAECLVHSVRAGGTPLELNVRATPVTAVSFTSDAASGTTFSIRLPR
jgi:hypothetical protein